MTPVHRAVASPYLQQGPGSPLGLGWGTALQHILALCHRPPDAACLFAILGPSGAGKTTLLDILAGRKRDAVVTGDVRADGLRIDNRCGAQHAA